MNKSRFSPIVWASSLVTLTLAGFFAFPFLWMFMASFKTNLEIFTPFPLLPKHFDGSYFHQLFSGEWIPYIRQYFNSLFIAVTQTLGALILSLGCGYIFGSYQFRYKNFLFATAILVILVPHQVMVLPLFIWMNKLHLLDTGWSVILPGIVSGIGVLYFTQLYRIFPHPLLDLARTEGANEYQVFFTSLPLILPHILTYILIHFILAWHEHIVPMVMLSSTDQQTLSVSLSALYGGSMRIPYAILMSGSLLTIIPTALFYLLTRKYFLSTLKEFNTN